MRATFIASSLPSPRPSRAFPPTMRSSAARQEDRAERSTPILPDARRISTFTTSDSNARHSRIWGQRLAAWYQSCRVRFRCSTTTTLEAHLIEAPTMVRNGPASVFSRQSFVGKRITLAPYAIVSTCARRWDRARRSVQSDPLQLNDRDQRSAAPVRSPMYSSGRAQLHRLHAWRRPAAAAATTSSTCMSHRSLEGRKPLIAQTAPALNSPSTSRRPSDRPSFRVNLRS